MKRCMKPKKDYVVCLDDIVSISPLFEGRMGQRLAKAAIRLFALDKINDLYARACHKEGADFAAALLQELKIQYQIGHPERLKTLPEGAFICISNHPYGGLDGIILVDMLGHFRPDFKVMVNDLLSWIEAMDAHFISVKPKGNAELGVNRKNINGIRETIQHQKEGHPIGFFPAGAVSNLYVNPWGVRDRPWQESVIRIIQKSNVPVLPIRFFNGNSSLFYFLGLLDWRIRLLRMPREVFNKSKQNPLVGIGEWIEPDVIQGMKDVNELSEFLRNSVDHMPHPVHIQSASDFFQARFG